MSEEDEHDPPHCECDSTHRQNDTVCMWCWKRGRRKWNDPDVEPEEDERDECPKCGRYALLWQYDNGEFACSYCVTNDNNDEEGS